MTPRSVEKPVELPKVRINSDYAFDVNDNLAICDRKATKIDFVDTVDDYAGRINRALAALSRDGGGSVVLGQGIYPVSSQIIVGSNACIRGQGMLRTMLRMKPSSPPYNGAGMIRMKDVSRVSVLDLTLDGARSTQANRTQEDVYGRYGLYAEKFSYLWIQGVRAINHREYGFDPHGTRDSWSHYLVMQDCVADNNGKDGFALDQTNHISLLDSAARRNARHGVNIVTGSRDVLMRRVSVDFNGGVLPGSFGCGIIAQNNVKELQTQDIVIDNSTVTESPRGGVCISDSMNVTVSNLNTTITRFYQAPCFLLRQARSVRFKNAHCTARSGRRISEIQSIYADDKPGQVRQWLPRTNSVPSPWKNDMYCRYGVLYKNVCCPKVCGKKCGVTGCGQNKMASLCCRDAIMQADNRCTKTTAPCVMDPKYLVLPDVFIDAPRALKPGRTVSPAVPAPPAGEPKPKPVAIPLNNNTGEVQQNKDVMQVVAIDTEGSTKAVPIPTPDESETMANPSGADATDVDEEKGPVFVDAQESKSSNNPPEVTALPQSEETGDDKTVAEVVVNAAGTTHGKMRRGVVIELPPYEAPPQKPKKANVAESNKPQMMVQEKGKE